MAFGMMGRGGFGGGMNSMAPGNVGQRRFSGGGMRNPMNPGLGPSPMGMQNMMGGQGPMQQGMGQGVGQGLATAPGQNKQRPAGPKFTQKQNNRMPQPPGRMKSRPAPAEMPMKQPYQQAPPQEMQQPPQEDPRMWENQMRNRMQEMYGNPQGGYGIGPRMGRGGLGFEGGGGGQNMYQASSNPGNVPPPSEEDMMHLYNRQRSVGYGMGQNPWQQY